jgi:hypothetical protein
VGEAYELTDRGKIRKIEMREKSLDLLGLKWRARRGQQAQPTAAGPISSIAAFSAEPKEQLIRIAGVPS